MVGNQAARLVFVQKLTTFSQVVTMIPRMKHTVMIVMVGLMGVLTGCFGGGGDPPPPQTTTIAGTASKGVVYPGAVTVYALDLATGTKVTPALSTTTTDVNGRFSTDIGVYSGPVLVTVSGTYTDEASSTQVVIDADRPMRAVIADAGPASKRYAVTPLTDLAATLALSNVPVTSENIVAANARISELFRISDILRIEPVANAAMMGSATVDQQAYTLALATLSQMAGNSRAAGQFPAFSQIDALLTGFSNDLKQSSTSVLSSTNASSFANALATVTQPGAPLSGFPPATDALASAGSKTFKLILAAGQTSEHIGAIKGDILLPSYASVRTDASGQVLNSLITLTGTANSVIATYSLSNRLLHFEFFAPDDSTAPFTGGDFATFVIDAASGTPAATDASVASHRVVNITGSDLAVQVTIK